MKRLSLSTVVIGLVGLMMLMWLIGIVTDPPSKATSTSPPRSTSAQAAITTRLSSNTPSDPSLPLAVTSGASWNTPDPLEAAILALPVINGCTRVFLAGPTFGGECFTVPHGRSMEVASTIYFHAQLHSPERTKLNS